MRITATIVTGLALAAVGIVRVLAGGSEPATAFQNTAGASREQAYRENNRGVALLEQFRPEEAAAAFRAALALAPDLAHARINLAIALLNVPDAGSAEVEAKAAVAAQPASAHAHYVLGLIMRGANRNAEAKAAFARVLALDPQDPSAQINLGQLLLQERSFKEAQTAFTTALTAEPHNATAAYNLGLALTRDGQAEEGRKAMERFRLLRESGYAKVVGQTYPEQGRYAEAIASTGAEADLVDQALPTARFVDITAVALPSGAPAPSAGPASPGGGRVTLFDLDGDFDLDLFDVGPGGQRLYRNDSGRLVDITTSFGLNPSQGGAGAVASDLDNDTWPDLLVLRPQGVTLYRSDAGKRLLDVTAASGLSARSASNTAVLSDLDHDGDLDVLIGGRGPDRLYQNAGTATFKDVAGKAGLDPAMRTATIVATDYDNGRDMDLIEVTEGGRVRLLRNLRDGTFRDVAAEAGLGGVVMVKCVAVGDVNKDSHPDFFFGAADGDLLALSDGRGRFAVKPAPSGSRNSAAAQFIDYDADGLLDLLTFSEKGGLLHRSLGGGYADVTAEALATANGLSVASLTSGDLDGDGKTDLVLRLSTGALRVLRNDGGVNGSVRVRLKGLVSNRSGVGSKVELRAGSLFQKLETAASTPAVAPSDLVFGLGKRAGADAVRVIWPSGTVQTETPVPGSPNAGSAARFEVKELNRKPSSCPYLYSWNGSTFEFITDFMGGGEMGYLVEPGVWNQPNPIEYVRLTDEQLKARDGRYQLRVTNELEEALFVDRIALVTVAHPADVLVYPNEGMTSPPKPHRIFTLKNPRTPAKASDDHGHDVLDRIARLDRRYPDDFPVQRIRGYAEPHTLTLDLGSVTPRAALLLTGWTDYAWSSDNVAAHQAGLRMQPPTLEVEDPSGRWFSAIEQIGVPIGRPQTVVADLTDIWKGPSRRVRIKTNMRIYWDEIRLADIVDGTQSQIELPASSAQLRERGFSAETMPDGRDPFGYDYDRVSPASPWKQFPGTYTREGDVLELLDRSDDLFVISRPGDEVAVSFDAKALKDLPSGWKRTFLVFTDGYSKEMDINSATPDVLGPLPFRGMSRYPYALPERYPATEERLRIMQRYNTRVAKYPLQRLHTHATDPR
jgi:tetratricopeptide (TPR) repeat protein